MKRIVSVVVLVAMMSILVVPAPAEANAGSVVVWVLGVTLTAGLLNLLLLPRVYRTEIHHVIYVQQGGPGQGPEVYELYVPGPIHGVTRSFSPSDEFHSDGRFVPPFVADGR